MVVYSTIHNPCVVLGRSVPGGASIQTQTAWSRQRTLLLWVILYLETQDHSRDPEKPLHQGFRGALIKLYLYWKCAILHYNATQQYKVHHRLKQEEDMKWVFKRWFPHVCSVWVSVCSMRACVCVFFVWGISTLHTHCTTQEHTCSSTHPGDNTIQGDMPEAADARHRLWLSYLASLLLW